MKLDTILILDFGGQYCHLIGRRIREHNVYSEIVPYDISIEEIRNLEKKFNIKGLVLSGGPSDIGRGETLMVDKRILESGFPILGLCYGHQLIAHLMGGKVKKGKKGEYGISFMKIRKSSEIFRNLKKSGKVWMSHRDSVYELPRDFEVLACTENCPIAAYRSLKSPIYGLQFHPEVAHTEDGAKILENFIFRVCGSTPNWKINDFVKESKKEIRKEIDDKTIVGLSGGVDSSVATAIASQVLGEKLIAVFVDHGFMREGEPEEINKTFSKFKMNFISSDSRERFLRKLKGVTDPEEKRKIIGNEFIRVFEEIARKYNAKYLIQGTIYPDRIESGFRKNSERIKTHHNVGGLPTKIRFKKIVEPLRNLYKDEVRKVGDEIGLPGSIVNRQPFPGPGLAVRIIGEVTKERLDILKKADKIVVEEIEAAKIKNLWQYFAVFTNTRSTGIKGDSRAYGYTIAIRIVESKEAMTANFARIPYEILEKMSTRITNEIPEVTRVVYDITHKPPACIEWE
ncbi:MAG: glutamine-hydrolyzing GMP synthase [Candidatus Micrarchaeales archaeon]|jgi:GMP synthase (glutamine-hydrolysing)